MRIEKNWAAQELTIVMNPEEARKINEAINELVTSNPEAGEKFIEKMKEITEDMTSVKVA